MRQLSLHQREPPLTYLARWRLHLAARLLQTTQKSILHMAMDVDYEFEAAFNRAFKREFSLPPAQYRRKLAANGAGLSANVNGTTSGAGLRNLREVVRSRSPRRPPERHCLLPQKTIAMHPTVGLDRGAAELSNGEAAITCDLRTATAQSEGPHVHESFQYTGHRQGAGTQATKASRR